MDVLALGIGLLALAGVGFCLRSLRALRKRIEALAGAPLPRAGTDYGITMIAGKQIHQ